MNINMQSVLKAVVIGAGINAIIGIISGASALLNVNLINTAGVLLACCGWFLIPVTAGALYGYFTPGKETLGEAAAGGAISGMMTGLVYGLLNGIVRAVISLVVDGNSFSVVMNETGSFVLLSCCGAVIFGSALGAVGGMIWTAVQGDK